MNERNPIPNHKRNYFRCKNSRPNTCFVKGRRLQRLVTHDENNILRGYELEIKWEKPRKKSIRKRLDAVQKDMESLAIILNIVQDQEKLRRGVVLATKTLQYTPIALNFPRTFRLVLNYHLSVSSCPGNILTFPRTSYFSLQLTLLLSFLQGNTVVFLT